MLKPKHFLTELSNFNHTNYQASDKQFGNLSNYSTPNSQKLLDYVKPYKKKKNKTIKTIHF